MCAPKCNILSYDAWVLELFQIIFTTLINPLEIGSSGQCIGFLFHKERKESGMHPNCNRSFFFFSAEKAPVVVGKEVKRRNKKSYYSCIEFNWELYWSYFSSKRSALSAELLQKIFLTTMFHLFPMLLMVEILMKWSESSFSLFLQRPNLCCATTTTDCLMVLVKEQ